MYIFKRELLAKTDTGDWTVIRTDIIIKELTYLNLMDKIENNNYDTQLFPYDREFSLQDVIRCNNSMLNRRDFLVYSANIDSFGLQLRWYISDTEWEDD